MRRSDTGFFGQGQGLSARPFARTTYKTGPAATPTLTTMQPPALPPQATRAPGLPERIRQPVSTDVTIRGALGELAHEVEAKAQLANITGGFSLLIREVAKQVREMPAATVASVVRDLTDLVTAGSRVGTRVMRNEPQDLDTTFDDAKYAVTTAVRRLIKAFSPPPPPYRGSPLTIGMKGDDVRLWQSRMRKRGYTIDVNGVYDRKAADVCKAFQKDQGLKGDGIVGPRTWKASWA
jgi:hypothetical protein